MHVFELLSLCNKYIRYRGNQCQLITYAKWWTKTMLFITTVIIINLSVKLVIIGDIVKLI